MNKLQKISSTIKSKGIYGLLRKINGSLKYRVRHKLKERMDSGGGSGFVYHYYVRGAFEEVHPNVCHNKKAIFVHIPKTAGTSVKNLVGLSPEITMHTKPTNMVHKKTWDKYTSFTIIRNPLDRFFSNYFFHTSPKYSGGLMSICPELKKMNVKEYFNRLKKIDSNHIDPQHEFISHKYSSHILDVVCRLENIKKDIKKICKLFDVSECQLPHKNSSEKYKYDVRVKNRTMEKILKYYKKDFEIFGYKVGGSKIMKNYVEIES